MSTKLNAEEMAARRYTGDWDGKLGGYFVCRDMRKPDGCRIFLMSTNNQSYLIDRMNEGYAAAIREVAQPIADERDELVQLLRGCLFLMNTNSPAPKGTTLNEWGDIIPAMRAILNKHPKQ